MEGKLKLAYKLRTLAERGVGAEKQNAKRKLDALLEKYAISLEDLDDNSIQRESFKYDTAQRLILRQCIYKVMGKNYKVYRPKSNEKSFIVDCTKSESADIRLSFDFYWEKYTDEINKFNRAFILKNDLTPHDADTFKLSDLSPEELKEYNRVKEMMKILDKNDYRRQIFSTRLGE